MRFVHRYFSWFAIFVVVAAWSMSCSAEAADWEGVFEGTLGGKPVVVQLTVLDPVKVDANSRYSYLPKPTDLYLIPDGANDGHSFVEATDFSWSKTPEMEPKGVTGHWRIDVKGDVATGTWRSETPGLPELPINLKRLPLIQHAASEGVNIFALTYDDAVIRHIEFGVPHKPVTFGSVTVAYVADKIFGLAFPRLIKHPDKIVLEKVNAALTELHRDELKSYRGCKDDSLGQKQSGPDAVAEYYFNVEYASPLLLSISQHGTNHCGGAHFFQVFLVRTFDLGSMTRIGGDYDLDATPQGFGQIFKMDSKEERMAFENLWWNTWLKTAKATGEDTSQCIESEKVTGDLQANFYFTRQGLAVLENDNGYFDNMLCMGSGSTPAIIPWAKLKPFLKKGQSLLVTEID
jgi:hypothetical protein